MHLRTLAVYLLTFALIAGCGGDAPVNTQAAAPIVADPPANTSVATRPPSPTPRPTVALATATPAPTAVPANPTPASAPTSPPPTQLPATATLVAPTPTPRPTETQPEPMPTPTLDIAQQVARGKRLVERNNCLGCHSIDGKAYSAPTFQGLFGNLRQLEGGGTITADEEYLWQSIKRPNEKIVQGYFVDAMPTVFFSDAEADAMVEYIKSLE